MADEKIQVLVGLLGGASISQGSGGDIARDLRAIAAQISSRNYLKVTVGLDLAATKRQMKAQLQGVVNSVNVSQSVKGAGSKGAANGATAFETKAREDIAKSRSVIAGSKSTIAEGNVLISQSKVRVQLIREEALQKAQVAKAQRDISRGEQQSLAAQTQITNLQKQVAGYQTQWSAAMKDPSLSKQYNELLSASQSLKPDGIQAYKSQLADFSKACAVAGKDTRTLGAQLSSNVKKFTEWFGVAQLVMASIRTIRSMITSVSDLSKATVDLQIASGKTKGSVEALMRSYSKLGKEIGATTSEVAQGADTFLRQGYNEEDAKTLLTNAMMLSKLGQIDAAEASEALTSAMKGYNVEVKDSLRVVDMLAAVDMEAAASAGDLATAMAETAVSARVLCLYRNCSRTVSQVEIAAKI